MTPEDRYKRICYHGIEHRTSLLCRRPLARCVCVAKKPPRQLLPRHVLNVDSGQTAELVLDEVQISWSRKVGVERLVPELQRRRAVDVVSSKRSRLVAMLSIAAPRARK